MENFQVLLESIADRLRNPSPSLPRMDLNRREGNWNPLMIQFFEWESRGTEQFSWWRHFEKEAPRLAEMGFTQAWLPPPNKGMLKEGRGYDAYDLWDLGEFEQKEGKSTRWGTKDELLRASAVAKSHGVGIIIDAVLNHKLGGDRREMFSAVEVDPMNRNVALGAAKEIEGWTAFDFPGRKDRYSKFKWRHEHFTGVDWDHRSQSKGIFRVATKNRKGWSRRVDKEFGNYDFLLGIDIDHRHPDVTRDFMSWGPWVLDTTGSNGFRLDAIKHMDRKFLLSFIRNARSHGHRDLFAVAEYWSGEYHKIEPYIRALQGQVLLSHLGYTHKTYSKLRKVSFFDVPLHYNFHRASNVGAGYDLRTILNYTVVQRRPDDAVTFVDNHDTQEGQSLESWVHSNFKPQAYAIILLRSGGYPCVFYGDLYPCSFHDPEVARVLKLLIECRRCFAYGPLNDYIRNSPHRNCVGFTRLGEGSFEGCAVVLSNAEPKPNATEHTLRMNIGKRNANARFRNFLGYSGEITTGPDGWGDFKCAAGQIAVWVREAP